MSEIKQIEFMDEALRLAEEAALDDEVPVGAVIVREGRIIGRGRNQKEKKNSPISHAEIEAIQMAAQTLGDWRLTECTLYVTLEPCPMCLAACQQARIDVVVYGAHDPKGGALSLGYALHEDVRLNHRFKVNYQASEACGLVLKKFFSAKRSRKA